MLAALLTFQDQSEEVHNGNNTGTPPLTGRKSSGDAVSENSGAEAVEKIQVTAGVSYILLFRPSICSDWGPDTPERSHGGGNRHR
jgi:hypothetical protein